MSFDCHKQVVVIGAGIGGLTTAIRLTAIGYHIRVFESQPQVGGKLNCIKIRGFGFDTEPSLITMPGALHDLFQAVGRRLEEYLHLIVDPYLRQLFSRYATYNGSSPYRIASVYSIIYGLFSNQRLIPFVRPDKLTQSIRHLCFVGGSAHPAGGVPLIILSGKIVAEMIAWECPTI